jgi:tetratricopeptide (TPR) repeat protein
MKKTGEAPPAIHAPEPVPSGSEERPAEPSLRAPRFARGEVLSGRYRIVQFIGQGGMGEVYEAEDFELRERVALKTIRPPIGDEKSLDRFRREISMARRVTHPNVCRMYDLGHHRRGGSPEGGVAFLTMELLAGETLATRLARVGRIPAAQAHSLVVQMAAGLAAAHRAGIVHRDLKPGNVILVPAADGTLRAVITDFGLARPDPKLRAPDTLTVSSDGLMGTPSYMAPEQVQGAEPTPAADLYSLGVVIYEIVTGAKPFVADSPMATAVKRLTEPPASPRTYFPDLDPLWEAVILKCLERDPAQRFAGADEVIAALEGRLAVTRTEISGRRRRLGAALALLIVAAGAAAWLARAPGTPTAQRAPATIPARPSLAVLPFQNASQRSEIAWLGSALSEMIAWELGLGGDVRTIPGDLVARLRRDLSLPDAAVLAREALGQVRVTLGADRVLLGSYVPLAGDPPGQLRVDVVLQDAVTAQTLEAGSETGAEADLPELVSRCTARLRAKLGAPSAGPPGALPAFFPAGLPAQRAYFEGLHALRVTGPRVGLERLQAAAEAAPRSPAVHAALAEAWRGLGYGRKARDAAETAFELAADQPTPKRMALEVRYRSLAGEAQQAAEVQRRVVGAAPDDVESGLVLSALEIEAGRPQAALFAAEELRRIGGLPGGDPRIGLAVARAALAQNDDVRAQAEAAAAAKAALDRRRPLVAAAARRVEALAWLRLDRRDASVAAAAEAMRIAVDAEDRIGQAEALILLGRSKEKTGDSEGAAHGFQEACEIFRDIGDRQREADALAALAALWATGSDAGRARRTFEEALAIYREVEAAAGAGAVQLGLAGLLEGSDAAAALRTYERARADYGAAGDQAGETRSLLGSGPLRLKAGDRAGAWRDYEAAVALFAKRGDQRGAAAALTGLASALERDGDLTGAKRAYGDAVAILRRTRDAPATIDALAGLARVVALEGDLAAARVLLEETLDSRRGDGDASARSRATSGLARVLAEQGDLEAASAAADAALRTAQQSRDPRSVAEATHVLGVVRELRGQAEEAKARFQEAVALRRELADRGALAESLLGVASMSLATGQLTEAEAAAQEALEAYRDAGVGDGEALAQVVLAEALARGGRSGSARTAVSRARSQAARSESPPRRLAVAVAAARLRLVAGEAAGAARELEAVLPEAQQAGLVILRLEAAVALGAAEIAAGRGKGRSRLDGVEKEAAALGLAALARRAAAERE